MSDDERYQFLIKAAFATWRQELFGLWKKQSPSADGIERAFVEELAFHPCEDNTRLIYSDWLEERGDPRGEFLRADCQRTIDIDTHSDLRRLERNLKSMRMKLDRVWLAIVGIPYDVLLESFVADREYLCHSLVRLHTGLSLDEAAHLLESLPAMLKRKVCWTAAEATKKSFEAYDNREFNLQLALWQHEQYGTGVFNEDYYRQRYVRFETIGKVAIQRSSIKAE